MHWSFLDKYPIEVGGAARYNYFAGSDFVVETAEHDPNSGWRNVEASNAVGSVAVGQSIHFDCRRRL